MLKNVDFNETESDYAEDHVAMEYEASRATGIRKAQDRIAGDRQTAAAPIRNPVRTPVRPPVDKSGNVDYRLLDTPPFLRQTRRRAFLSPQLEPQPQPEPTPATTLKPDGVCLSSMAESFIGKMKSVPNTKLGCVDYMMPEESSVAFRRFPDAITVGERHPDDGIILAMLELGKSDFGAIEVYGSPEFVMNAVRVAIDNGIVLQNKEYAQALSGSRSRLSIRR